MSIHGHSWLPSLILLDSYSGNWDSYSAEIYRHFVSDFVNTKPSLPNKRVALKRNPKQEGREATFWHMITEGEDEASRKPDITRCERIKWPKPTMESFDDMKPVVGSRIKWWRNKRGLSNRIVLSLDDFSYVVIVDERDDFVLPWTHYLVKQKHRRAKLRKEFESYWALKG
jgi:hypothetical protein